MYKLCAILENEVVDVHVAERTADGELAAFGDGHLVVGGHAQ